MDFSSNKYKMKRVPGGRHFYLSVQIIHLQLIDVLIGKGKCLPIEQFVIGEITLNGFETVVCV